MKTATTVWDCSIVLAKYLEYQNTHKSPGFLQGKKVLELGAGTGLAGLASAALGALVTITDVEDVVPQLNRNIALNQDVAAQVKATHFDWISRSVKSPNLGRNHPRHFESL